MISFTKIFYAAGIACLLGLGLPLEASAQNCDPPFLLNVSQITDTSATLSWEQMGTENEWDISVVPAGTAPQVTLGGVMQKTLIYHGLMPGTLYDFYVRAVCNPDTSTWAKFPGSFLTKFANPTVCGLNLAIPDNDCLTLEFNVDNAPGTELGEDVYLQQVRIIIEHEWDDDLDISLTSPNGVTIDLSSDNGNGGQNFGDPQDPTCMAVTAFLSGQAPGACSVPSIEQGTAPYIGNFFPEVSLTAFNDGSSPQGIWQLEVCDDFEDDLGTIQYVELVFAPFACVAPSGMIFDDVTSSSVYLNWAPGGSCANSILEYGPAGFVPGTGAGAGGGTIVASGCPPYTLNGLSPEMAYDVYVREECEPGVFSNNSCPVTFTTPCSPSSPTIEMDFNNLPLCVGGNCLTSCATLSGSWFNIPSDEMDWLTYFGPTPTTSTGPNDDFPGGGRYIYMETSGGCAFEDRATLLSNCITINAPSPDTCHFSFDYYMYGSTVYTLTLQITTDGGQTWTTLWTEQGEKGQQWRRKFIGLNPYDGMTVQLRFVGRKGFTGRSDIGLDNLIFYGSVDEGEPENEYYLDLDMDGYGNSATLIRSCSDLSPLGYVEVGGDCNDNNPDVNPGEPEVPCDGFDSNCNGFGDEFDLPPPVVSGDTICAGDLGLLEAIPAYNGFIVWYDSAVGGTALDTGINYVPQPALQNNTDQPVTYSFYAEEQNNLGCASGTRAEATILVNPQPEIEVPNGQLSVVCAGDSLNLDNLIVQDVNDSNPVITYHDDYPPTPANEIQTNVLLPQDSQYIYIRAEAVGGCTDIDSVLIAVFTKPVVQIQGDTALCEDGSQLLEADVSGSGFPPFTFLWSNASDESTLLVENIGTVGTTANYAVTLTDDNGCTAADSVTMEVIVSIDSVQLDIQDVSFCEGDNGSISVNAFGATPPFSVSWQGPQTGSLNGLSNGFTISGLSSGVYSITVTDSSPQACPLVESSIVVNEPSAAAEIVSIQDVSCPGAQDGCIKLNVLSPTATIQWSTSPQDTLEELCGLSGGSYSVTITDADCANVLENITIFEPDSLKAVTSQVKPVTCFGGEDGAIFNIIGGGTLPYTFSWSNGATTQNLLGLPAGDYSLTVTDGVGCTLETGPITVAQPDSLVVSADLVAVTCNGGSNGSISINVSGGNPPYGYEWSNNSNLDELTDLSSGTYDLTVSDSKGCSVQITYFLAQPSAIAVELLNQADATCPLNTDGILDVGVTGGLIPYTLDWSNGADAALNTGLGVGTYNLTVTDKNGCQHVSDTFAIASGPGLDMGFTDVEASCLGEPDGAATVLVNDGVSPYSYLWENGDITASSDELVAGTYIVTVTDATGCIDTVTVEVGFSQPLFASISAFPPNCHDGDNGQIFLTPFGGQQPYTYAWSDGTTEMDAKDLVAGDYVCTVTDGSNCMLITDTITLFNPPPIFVEVEAVDSITCAGENDANIFVAAGGGVPPYDFTWSNDVTTEDLYLVGPGTYVLTVEDSFNCAVATQPVTITQPPPLTLSINLLDDQIDCSGNFIDTVFANASGGTPPYSYVWSNGSTDSFIPGFQTGDYSVTVKDINGCTAIQRSIKVPEATNELAVERDLSLLPYSDCDSIALGAKVRMLIFGGKPPYQYNWSTGPLGSTNNDTIALGGLDPGAYNVTVTDDLGCVVVSDSFTVFAPVPLTAFLPGNGITQVSCKGGSDGSIKVNVQGGIGPYSYIWVHTASGDTVATDPIATGLSTGIYEVVVTDQIGCTKKLGNLTVPEPATDITVSLEIENIFCFGDETGTINATVTGGSPPYDFLWSTGAETEDIDELSAGFYTVSIEDSQGCVLVQDSIQVIQPADLPFLVDFEVMDALCADQASGAIDITVDGGTPEYTYFWSNNKFTQDISGLAPDTYFCQVFDANGCSFTTQTFEVSAPSPIVLVGISVDSASNDGMDGQLEISLDGGTMPYDISWSNGDTGAVADSLAEGFYDLMVEDANGCIYDTTIFLPQQIINTVDEPLDMGLSLRPNPAKDRLWIEWETNDFQPSRVALIDQFGREVLQQKVEQAQMVELDVYHLPAGVYWVKLEVEGKGVALRKVILIE